MLHTVQRDSTCRGKRGGVQGCACSGVYRWLNKSRCGVRAELWAGTGTGQAHEWLRLQQSRQVGPSIHGNCSERGISVANASALKATGGCAVGKGREDGMVFWAHVGPISPPASSQHPCRVHAVTHLLQVGTQTRHPEGQRTCVRDT